MDNKDNKLEEPLTNSHYGCTNVTKINTFTQAEIKKKKITSLLGSAGIDPLQDVQ